MNKCEHIKSDGNRCKARPLKGSGLCFRHDPEQREAGHAASQRGGLNRRLQGVYGRAVVLKEPKDIQRLLGQVINAIWTGQAPAQLGSSMGFLSRCWLDAYDVAEVDKRIAEIEKRLETIER
jgi:hypothetical protein